MLYEKLMGSPKEPDKEIISVNGKGYSYRSLDCMVKNYASQVIASGYHQEERAVIFVHTGIFSICSILTCIYLGIPFILLDEKADSGKIKYIFELCRIKLIFGKKEDIQLSYGQKIITESMDFGDVIERKRNYVSEQRLGYILFTSGSTGMPKGVMANQREIIFCLNRIQRRIQNNEEDIILSTLPLVFDYGLYQVFLSLISGARLIWEPDCLIQKIPALLTRYEITALPVVPTTFHLLIKTRLLERIALPKLRYVCATGERWEVASIQTFHHFFPHVEILPMYGLTECKRVSIMPYGRYDKVVQGSCGIPLDDVEVVLCRKDENTEIGELVVVGENVMEGYYGDEQNDSIVFGQLNGKKALYTGDLFRIDGEGFLYFIERINGIIKRRGIRISCSEIEQFFLKEKSFLEVCALGIEDHIEGEKIALAIYTQNQKASELCREIIGNMPDVLKPSILKLYDVPLLKNENGKIWRKEIRRQMKEDNEL